MTAEIRVATLRDPEIWHGFHAESGIPSHSWSYAATFAASGIAPRIARVSDGHGRLIIPFYERAWRGTTDVCTLLSVSGAYARPPVAGLVDAWSEFSRAQGWVAGYLQFGPESPQEGLEDAHEANEVFLVDLAVPDILAPASQLIRRKVRRAAAEGATLVENRDALAEALVHLYPRTLERVGASAAYSLPAAALHVLAQASEVMILGAGGPERIESVMVFPYTGQRAEFFLNAGTERGRSLSAWLLTQAMRRLAGAGVEVLNLGGGVRTGDGLHRFKAMFGASSRPLRALRQIYDAETYTRLCAQAGARPGTAWFPGYRAAGLPDRG